MSLSSRIAANRCAVDDCQRARHEDAAVCREDLGELWNHRLERKADGTYRRRRLFIARDMTGRVGAAA